jgi:hypothetical protein
MCCASHTPVARPQPISRSPARMDSGSCWSRAQPNVAAPSVTCAPCLAREPFVFVLILLGVVLRPQLERVHPECVGQLVHGAVERVHAPGGVWRTHANGRLQGKPRHCVIEPGVVAPGEHPRPTDDDFAVIFTGRRLGECIDVPPQVWLCALWGHARVPAASLLGAGRPATRGRQGNGSGADALVRAPGPPGQTRPHVEVAALRPALPAGPAASAPPARWRARCATPSPRTAAARAGPYPA